MVHTMDMSNQPTMIQHTHLFLATCPDWTHQDGTAPIRVHLAITPVDENGGFWAVRGTTRHDNRNPGQAVFVRRDAANNLKRDTTFVTTQEGIVYVTTNQVRRVTGQVDEATFNKIWDQIEVK